MFSRIWTKLSTKSCSEPLERLQTALRDCDAVVIGAGAGLSTSAGFVYTDERFKKYFSDFAEKYDIKDMYSGGFYPFATPKSIGPIGAGIFTSTAIWMPPNRSMMTS